MQRLPLLAMCLIAFLVAAVVAAPFLYFGSAFVVIVAGDQAARRDLPLRVDPVPFESAAWCSDTSGFGALRLAMLDDLLASRALIGKSRSELAVLLGGPGQKPENRGSMGVHERLLDWDLVYTVGNRDLSSDRFGPSGIDFSYLVVRFDTSGRVLEVAEIRG